RRGSRDTSRRPGSSGAPARFPSAPASCHATFRGGSQDHRWRPRAEGPRSQGRASRGRGSSERDAGSRGRREASRRRLERVEDDRERDQREPEGADDRRARREVERRRGDHAEHADERAEAPADQKLARDRAPEHDAGERGYDEVRKYEEHAGDPHGARDDDAERRVEEEVPNPDPPAIAEGGIRGGRDQEERAAAQPVKDADG